MMAVRPRTTVILEKPKASKYPSIKSMVFYTGKEKAMR
jgi:hypothetical protein